MAVSASRMSKAAERQAEHTWLATRSCRSQRGGTSCAVEWLRAAGERNLLHLPNSRPEAAGGGRKRGVPRQRHGTLSAGAGGGPHPPGGGRPLPMPVDATVWGPARLQGPAKAKRQRWTLGLSAGQTWARCSCEPPRHQCYHGEAACLAARWACEKAEATQHDNRGWPALVQTRMQLVCSTAGGFPWLYQANRYL